MTPRSIVSWRATPWPSCSAAAGTCVWSRAERQAVEDTAMLAGTALVLPPRLFATFSLWRNAPAMRAYAHGVSDEHHRNAMRANTAQPFHHESAFIRFRPHAPQGLWWGARDPFAEVTLPSAAARAAGVGAVPEVATSSRS
jgi:hypothetical protein